MTQEEKDIIGTAPLILILSSKTGKPYIDKTYTSHLFQEPSKAEAFCMTEGAGSFGGAQVYRRKDILSQCYAAGAQVLIVHQREGLQRIAIAERYLARDYYNNTLNGILARVRETKDISLMADIKACPVIIPAIIRNRDDGVDISYCVVDMGEGRYYIAFSDLSEYRMWAGRHKGWQPLAVRFSRYVKTSRGDGIILNPEGSRFVMTPAMLAEARKIRKGGGK